jgi:hypothetical protein
MVWTILAFVKNIDSYGYKIVIFFNTGSLQKLLSNLSKMLLNLEHISSNKGRYVINSLHTPHI